MQEHINWIRGHSRGFPFVLVFKNMVYYKESSIFIEWNTMQIELLQAIILYNHQSKTNRFCKEDSFAQKGQTK